MNVQLVEKIKKITSMKNIVFILLCWCSIASNAQTKSVVGKWKTEDQTVVDISPISDRSFK